MKRTVAAVLGGIFALILASPDVMADSDAKKLAKACKGKKPGTEVTVHGTKVKCPAVKK